VEVDVNADVDVNVAVFVDLGFMTGSKYPPAKPAKPGAL
jgi:hypothetical protein